MNNDNDFHMLSYIGNPPLPNTRPYNRGTRTRMAGIHGGKNNHRNGRYASNSTRRALRDGVNGVNTRDSA